MLHLDVLTEMAEEHDKETHDKTMLSMTWLNEENYSQWEEYAQELKNKAAQYLLDQHGKDAHNEGRCEC